MLTLEQLLEERIKNLGENHPAVQMLRNQIAAERDGQSFRDLYLTGSLSKTEPKAGYAEGNPEDEH